MKLKYTKPAMVMERFELSQSIAAGCEAASSSTVGDPNQWTKQTCGWKIDDTYILWFSEPICFVPMGDSADGLGLCYNNPEGGQTIFNS